MEPDPDHTGLDGADETRRFRRNIGKALSAMSVLSALAAAVIGTVAVIFVGPYLVMGAAIYTGNTEPELPQAPYPWGLALLGIAALIAGSALARSEEHDRAGHMALHAAAIFLALLPLWHLLTLWDHMPLP